MIIGTGAVALISTTNFEIKGARVTVIGHNKISLKKLKELGADDG
nr:hypothetical protein [Saccharolobus solfataricus]